MTDSQLTFAREDPAPETDPGTWQWVARSSAGAVNFMAMIREGQPATGLLLGIHLAEEPGAGKPCDVLPGGTCRSRTYYQLAADLAEDWERAGRHDTVIRNRLESLYRQELDPFL
jgi:hypothetical protein